MKTLTLVLAVMINLSVLAQAPKYTKINANTIQVTWYHDNGNVKETGFFTNGVQDGLWLQYNESGSKTSEASFNNGVKEGNWSVWNDEGTLTYHMVYENGKRILTTQWDGSGNLIAGVQEK